MRLPAPVNDPTDGVVLPEMSEYSSVSDPPVTETPTEFDRMIELWTVAVPR